MSSSVYSCSEWPHLKVRCHREGQAVSVVQMGISAHTFDQRLHQGIQGFHFHSPKTANTETAIYNINASV